MSEKIYIKESTDLSPGFLKMAWEYSRWAESTKAHQTNDPRNFTIRKLAGIIQNLLAYQANHGVHESDG